MIFKKVFLYTSLILLCFIKIGSVQAKSSPQSTLGTLDLSHLDFNVDDPIQLGGEWEFYWYHLVSPDSIIYFDNIKSYRQFDLLWAKDSVTTNKGFATYRLRIKVSRNAPKLALFIPDFYCAYSLYLNNELIAKNGQVGKSKESSVPHWLPMTLDLPEVGESIEFVLHISNFRHSKGGASRKIILGESNRMHKIHNRDAYLDLLLTGCLLMTAFFFLGLYWFGKHDMQLLFFGLYSLMYSYRIFGFGIYTFHSMFPDIPWIITLRIEYLTLFLSSLFFACYTYQLYKEETSIHFLRVAAVLSIIFSFVALILPASIFTLLVGPYFVVLLAGFVYIFYTYVLAVYNNRTGSKLSLVGTSIILIVFGFNILVYFGITPEQKIFTFSGYFIFFFIQSIILFNLHTVRLNLAKTRAETISNSKTEFLSTVSHEMRTPLNSIIGLSKYLIKDNPKQEHLEDLENLKHSAETLNFLINDVLDYSKIEAGRIVFDYTDLNIYELVKKQIASLESRAKEKKLRLSYHIDSDIPQILVCDGFRLNQVLTNLLGNAIKFTPAGQVKLSLTRVNQSARKIAIKFSVIDTGIGISEKNHETIFDNYIQALSSTEREFGGTGLGLAITQKILALQNVKIHVSSSLGKGAEFYFTQEFEISKTQNIPDNITSEKVHGFEGKIVLLVEDNPANVMIETKFLERWNILVDVAENGKVAIERVKANKYDLILMDLRMPVMDGYESTKILREIGVSTPIIALTASGISNVGTKLFEAGMNDFIRKPFDPDDMYAKIKKYLG